MFKNFISHQQAGAVQSGGTCAWAWTEAGFLFFFQGGPHFGSNQPRNASQGHLKIPHLGIYKARETLKLETLHVVKHRLKYWTGEIFGKI